MNFFLKLGFPIMQFLYDRDLHRHERVKVKEAIISGQRFSGVFKGYKIAILARNSEGKDWILEKAIRKLQRRKLMKKQNELYFPENWLIYIRMYILGKQCNLVLKAYSVLLNIFTADLCSKTFEKIRVVE